MSVRYLLSLCRRPATDVKYPRPVDEVIPIVNNIIKLTEKSEDRQSAQIQLKCSVGGYVILLAHRWSMPGFASGDTFWRTGRSYWRRPHWYRH